MKQLIPIFLLLSLLAGAGCAKKQVAPETTEKPVSGTEPHRPQYHFSPPANWMNDPNGMVYYEGEYHLFYQYYPDSTVWGPMHWGHAVSPDMIHWEHLPVALYPDSLGYIFSGSAVVDHRNTSGLGQKGQPPMVAIFTHHDPAGDKAGRIDFQVQSIAYSLDKGRTWTKYAGNPVLPNPGIRDFRDPKVMWHEPSGKWIMTLACQDHIRFYSSANLLKWDLESEFGKNLGAHGGVWECPDLFELPLNGKKHWVLLVSINPGGPNGGSATQYFVGDFDGKIFRPVTPKPEILWVDHGRDNYAGVTWSNIPEKDGRRLFLGWMSNWDYGQVTPTQAWRSAMTLPRELSLAQTVKGIRLVSQPVRELAALRSGQVSFGEKWAGGDLPLAVNGDLLEIEASFFWKGAAPDSLGLVFFNDAGDSLRVNLNPATQTLVVDRSKAGPNDFSEKFVAGATVPIDLSGGRANLRLFLDWSSLEVFTADGLIVATMQVFPRQPLNQVKAFSSGGGGVGVKGMAYSLKRALL